ncbi:MAG: pantoate--beta-alanine ligase [Gemmatimonadota bacterium]|nr:MAG: pantoate--beta-alanine ligase [Gemmatimonadota bacterium]
MRLVRRIVEVRELVGEARRNGLRIGLVPTMGFLHEGHLSLVDRCRELSDLVVMSIFVNPLQFGPSEDLESYPRDMERDLALAEGRRVDLVFAPANEELYPEPPTAVVAPRRLADRLCGASRPGHFEGVLTVVAKLFGIVQPDVSVFGQKDFQQAVLIQRMVSDLNMAVRVEVAPTVREPDGLAMSSRNAYLSGDERARAVSISQALAWAVAAFRSGERDAGLLRSQIRVRLDAVGGVDVEYVEAVSARDLEPVSSAAADTVMAIAARIGSTRLIDNACLGNPDPGLAKLL